MGSLQYQGDNILSEEEIVKQASKCLRLLGDVPISEFTDWEQTFVTNQEVLNIQFKPCSFKELTILRDMVGKYVT